MMSIFPDEDAITKELSARLLYR